jgi:hypothetical protein
VDGSRASGGRGMSLSDSMNGFRRDFQSSCPGFESQPAHHFSLASALGCEGFSRSCGLSPRADSHVKDTWSDQVDLVALCGPRC